MNHTITFMNVKKFSLILGKGHSVNYVQLCEQCHDCILVSFMCILYNQQDANLYSFLYYYRHSTCFGRVFRPSSGACKTVCAALGIVMLSCCLLLVRMCWNCSASNISWTVPTHQQQLKQSNIPLHTERHTQTHQTLRCRITTIDFYSLKLF